MLPKDRLKQARLKADKTQEEVAQAVKMSQPAYQALEAGRNKKSAFLPEIADFLGVNLRWLKNGEGEMTSSQSQSQNQDEQSLNQPQTGQAQRQIQHMNFVPPVEIDDHPNERKTPVLSWVQAGDFTYVLSADLSSAIDWIPYDSRAGKYGFALKVKGASMEPEFKPDEFIYINPTYQMDELNTGALVVMACNGDTEATFKELVVEDGNYYLRPLNQNWEPKIIPIDHTCSLVGKVVGKYNRY